MTIAERRIMLKPAYILRVRRAKRKKAIGMRCGQVGDWNVLEGFSESGI